jgi:diguanylate cyclase (GGDEF)-like protein/PAS domain S-box-containing protein
MGAKDSKQPDNLRHILDHVSDGVYFVDESRRVTWWSQAAERTTGYSADEMVGHRCANDRLVHCDASGKILCGAGCPLDAVLQGHQPETCHLYVRCKNGSRVPVAVSAYPMVNSRGEVVGVAEIFRSDNGLHRLLDNAAQVNAEAYLDPLTGIANRRFGELCLRQLVEVSPQLQKPGALLFLDVDHFKEVNDSLGHLAGDAVLRAVAQTLRNAVRSNDLVCRWGGEEFLILLAGISRDQMIEVAERCRVLVAQSSCQLDDTLISVTCSIGAAMLHPKDDPHSILARADSAMYHAKRNGRNRVLVADDMDVSRNRPVTSRKSSQRILPRLQAAPGV